jgi:hypothetical protein
VLSPVVIAGAFVALACWVLTVVKVCDAISDPANRSLRYLTATLAALSASMTFQPLAQWLDHTTGVLDLGRAAGNCCAIVGAGCAQIVLLRLAYPEAAVRPRARVRLIAMAMSVAAVAALFLLTPARYSVDDPYVVSHAYYYMTPSAAAAPYQFVVIAYLGWAAGEAVLRSYRYGWGGAASLLRAGMGLISLGSGLVLLYLALKLATIALPGVAPGFARYVQNHLLVTVFTVASLTILVGATLPSWGPRVGLDRLWERRTAGRQCRQLGPLWTLVCTAVPQVAMLPHPVEPRLRRARMTVEILDGYVHLRQWISVTAIEQARAHAVHTTAPGPDRDAAIEAAVLAVAARAARDGVAPVDGDALAPPLTTLDAAAPGDPHVARLIRVAEALRRSPVVATALAKRRP